jgi:hypothetical protein
VNNNPVNWVDPLGLTKEKEPGKEQLPQPGENVPGSGPLPPPPGGVPIPMPVPGGIGIGPGGIPILLPGITIPGNIGLPYYTKRGPKTRRRNKQPPKKGGTDKGKVKVKNKQKSPKQGIPSKEPRRPDPTKRTLTKKQRFWKAVFEIPSLFVDPATQGPPGNDS